jgi:hypothetical protein
MSRLLALVRPSGEKQMILTSTTDQPQQQVENTRHSTRFGDKWRRIPALLRGYGNRETPEGSSLMVKGNRSGQATCGRDLRAIDGDQGAENRPLKPSIEPQHGEEEIQIDVTSQLSENQQTSSKISD